MKIQKYLAATGLALVLMCATGCASGYDYRTSVYMRNAEGNTIFFGIDYNKEYDGTQDMKCGFLFGHEYTEEGAYAVYYSSDDVDYVSVYSVPADFSSDESYNMSVSNADPRVPSYNFRKKSADFLFHPEWFPKDQSKCFFALAKVTDELPVSYTHLRAHET